MVMSQSRIIISGAGIAGAVLAYWLGKNGFQVVVVERSMSKSQAQQGQIVDVEGSAEQVIDRMGLLKQIQDSSTHEAGIRIVESSGHIVGAVPAGETSFSKTIEIMRPTLANILVEAADRFDNVSFRYGSTVQSVRQTADRVIVEIKDRESGKITEDTFELFFASDGLRSKTREMILSPDERAGAIKSLNFFGAFFTIPAEARDRPWSNIHSTVGRRIVSIKPLDENSSSVFLGCCKSDPKLREARESRDPQVQKKVIAEYFADVGWETPRILEGMKTTDNFYFEEFSQIKLGHWSEGRCALLGDTAYCPSPLTGQGTTLAILGAYILASEVVKNRERPLEAFEVYERNFRTYVNKVQPVPFGGYLPLLLNPETAWGVWILRLVASFICWIRVWNYFPAGKPVPYGLPDL